MYIFRALARVQVCTEYGDGVVTKSSLTNRTPFFTLKLTLRFSLTGEFNGFELKNRSSTVPKS